ncbi:TIGR02611 family protein [Lolliginicoccus suaedae]|uniref:TIGR02611 family protein n=1 Tax=Lolliginicoccus suaedae TaxID=2605429 RepID=UPI0038B3940E
MSRRRYVATRSVAAMRAVRAQFKRHPLVALAYQVTVAIVGAVVLVIGVIAIPYPGPGWLIVFAGLGILATEFPWARRILHDALGRYRAVMAWYKRQHGVVRVAGAAGTVILTVMTLWLLGAIGLTASWFGIDHPWLGSPLS